MEINENTVAIVTGGASGLGAATATALALKGVKINIFDMNPSLGDAMAETLSGDFYQVDVSDSAAVAAAAKAAGVDHFLVVTAVGANPDASVFYFRMKGQTEGQLMKMGFKRLDIIRPGLLLGDRKERRPIEVLLQHIAPATDLLMHGKWRRYRSVQAADAAHCLLGLAASNEHGVYIHHFDDIMKVLQSPLQEVSK